MAYEIYQPGLPTGLTLSVKFLIGGSAAATVLLHEAPASAYGNTMDLSLAAGSYACEIVDGAGAVYATSDEPFEWDGSAQRTIAGVEATLAAIEAQTNKIATNNTTLIGSMVNGQLSIVAGDSYTATSGKAIAIPRPAGATYPADLTGWTVTLHASAKASTIGQGATSFSTVLAISNPATTQDLTINALPASTTSGLVPGINGWTFSIVATKTSDVNTLMSGVLSVAALTVQA
jgi:hypothetical protein